MTAAELDRILKLLALIQLGANEVLPFIARLKAQGSETPEQILAHAEKANQEARQIIDSL